jgi:hypothetical protein
MENLRTEKPHSFFFSTNTVIALNKIRCRHRPEYNIKMIIDKDAVHDQNRLK